MTAARVGAPRGAARVDRGAREGQAFMGWARHTALACAIALALLACAAIAHADRAPRPDQGTIERLRMPAPSVGDDARSVRVYLPPSYRRPESAQRRYPVVYMLHGWPGGDGNLLELGHANATADSLIARHAIPEIVMVFPSGAGSGTLGRSFWIDSYDGKKRVEQYVTRDLVAWVDARYRTVRAASGRGLIGISEGGNAAFCYAFKHPDLFSACGAHSTDFVLHRGFGTGAFLGPDPGARVLLDANSPERIATGIVPQLRHQRLYFDCGVGDESIGPSRAFDAELTTLGVAHEFHEFPGTHSWGYWSRHLRESLLAVASALH